MKNIIFRYSILFILVSFVFANIGCRRTYKDGPTISFASKESRVVNDWKASNILRNEYDDNMNFTKYELKFDKGGKSESGGNFEWIIRPKGDTVDTKYEGKWYFAVNGRQIKLDIDETKRPLNGYQILFMEIYRLTANEMWVKYQLEKDYYFIQMTSK
jgi:hypothetical protein